MVSNRAPPRLAPLAVGVALLALVVAIAILPNTGAVPAASNCQYGVCTSSSPSTSSYLIVLGVLALIALALLVLILRGRQRTPTSPQEWEPGTSASGGPGGESPDVPAGVAAGAIGGGALGAGATAAYVETPEDVSGPSPVVPMAGAAAVGAGAGAAASDEPDIDSLMAELDKISGEILTRGNAAKKPPTSGGSDGA